MKDQQQRIAVAEAYGWRNVNDCYGAIIGIMPESEVECSDEVPDYLNDLIACDTLIDWMNERGWSCVLVAENSARCCTFVRDGVEHKVIKSTFQRAICESFLRAVGKWQN